MLRAQTAAGLLLVGLSSGCYEREPIVRADDSRCTAVVESLFTELYDVPQGCVAVMEYDDEFSLQRWALVCHPDPTDPIEEAQARRQTVCCEMTGTAVNRDNPSDAFVFYDVDEMGNGNIAVVSQHTNRRVFEASLSNGSANISLPENMEWRSPDDLAIDCNAEMIAQVASYDEDGDIPPAAEVELLDTIGRTGIPDAMRSGDDRGDGQLLWTILLRAGTGANGRWIALLQASSADLDFT